MKRPIELYGRLRDAGLGDVVEIELEPGALARDALAALERLAGSPGLIQGVALATESEVLSRDAEVPAACRLAALPPVCGG